uniref:Uncharacterized protein n=1 Tax=Psilocybe cubensis TaxID=181762 RepID=A0A8H7XNX3_PSICU
MGHVDNTDHNVEMDTGDVEMDEENTQGTDAGVPHLSSEPLKTPIERQGDTGDVERDGEKTQSNNEGVQKDIDMGVQLPNSTVSGSAETQDDTQDNDDKGNKDGKKPTPKNFGELENEKQDSDSKGDTEKSDDEGSEGKGNTEKSEGSQEERKGSEDGEKQNSKGKEAGESSNPAPPPLSNGLPGISYHCKDCLWYV